ncbi:MAG: hypothetical protein P9M07_08705 [Candidatus Aceula meridiana]|nr:hypothetical protein [Candidatus Aceula meridiana]
MLTIDSGQDLKGGIDLDSANLDMDIQGEAIEFEMPQGLQGIDPAQIQGFIPVIINITPIANFYSMLEIPEEEQLSMLAN